MAPPHASFPTWHLTRAAAIMTPHDLAERVLNSTDVAFLATCDGAKPRVRPVNVALREGFHLWIASYSHWGKVGQLQANPHVEVTVMEPTGAHVRIVGRGVIHDDVAVKGRILAAFPLMQRYFKDPADPTYTLIEIVPEIVTVKDAWDLEYDRVDVGTV